MNVLVVFLFCAVVSVLSQTTLLDSQCYKECNTEHIAEIQSLRKMIETMRAIAVRLEKKIMELRSKVTELTNENVMVDDRFKLLKKELTKNNDAIVQLILKLTQLEPKSGPSIAVSSTSFDCEEIRFLGYNVSGVYSVNGGNGLIKQVYCEMSADNDTWTRILHRQDNLIDFTYKKWVDYEAGFGDTGGSHWMGLIQMNNLTTSRDYILRVDLEDWDGETRFAEYSMFNIGPASDKYQLTIGGYSGTASDSMRYHRNMQFTTIDQNNSEWFGCNCAGGRGNYTGGWWHRDFFYCFRARLTGPYLEGGRVPNRYGIQWPDWRGLYYSYKVATMKIKRL